VSAWTKFLRQARARLRPAPRWWLGTPYRITMAPAFDYPGYLLKLHRSQGVDWMNLPARAVGAACTGPDAREFTAAAEVLAAGGLQWALPWQLDGHGNLTAPVTRAAGLGGGAP
jgi:hypothetical protein